MNYILIIRKYIKFKIIKNFILLVVVFMIFLSCVTTASYSQNNNNISISQFITTLTDKGLLNNYKDKNPKSLVTRKEFAEIITQVFDLKLTDQEIRNFPDVDSSPNNPINILLSRGLIKGYEDNKFHPERTISRVQVISILNRITGTNIPGIPKFMRSFAANIILRGFYHDFLEVKKWAKIDIANASFREMIIVDTPIKGSKFYLRPKDHANFGDVISFTYLALSIIKPSEFQYLSIPDNKTITSPYNFYWTLILLAFIGCAIFYYKKHLRRGLIYRYYELRKEINIFESNPSLAILDAISMSVIGTFIIMFWVNPSDPYQALTSGLSWTALFNLIPDQKDQSNNI